MTQTASTLHRIAFVCPSRSNGGLEMTVVRLARSFQALGLDAVLYAPPDSPIFADAQRLSLRVHPFAPRMKYGDLPAAWNLGRALRDSSADLMLLFRSQDIHLAALAHRTAPRVNAVFYQQMQSAIDKRDWIHRWMYSHLALWLTLTERMRQDVIRCTTMPEDRVAVAPLGRDTALFDPGRMTQAEARTQFGLPEKGPIVGMLGRLDPQKGQEDLLRALPLILQRFPKSVAVIAGEETRNEEGYADTLRALAAKLGITASVCFLPPTNAVAQLLAAFDVFVLPSHSETYGLVLIEAMAMQRPIVATEAGGVPELARHNQEALLVLPRSPGHLGRAVVQLLSDAALRTRLADAARTRAVDVFDERRCVQHLLQLLEAVTPRFLF